MAAASLQTSPFYLATGFIVCIIIALTLPAFCSSAPLLHEAGNSSFIAGQQGSFWSSDAGNYSFGFSSINNGTDHAEYLLSVWHSADPNRTALWWAGLDDNPTVESGSTLNFTIDGNLELHNPQGTLLWSSSSSSASYAQLEDTGNLALLEKDGTSVSWQSFDHPRDSLMLSDLEDSIVVNKSFLLQSRSNGSSFGPGTFHIATDGVLNLQFHGVDSLHNDFIYVYASMNTSNGLQVSKDNLVLFISTPSANELQRMTLDYDGNLRVYMWESNISAWEAVWQMFKDKCLLGSPCGPFGICQEVGGSENGLNCSCPPGYRPRDAGDMSQGCESLISFNVSCGTQGPTNYSTSMVELPQSDYNYNDLTRHGNVNLNDCKVLCLNECRCMAASYRDDGVCFVKGNSQVGYLLNGHTSDSNTLLIKVVGPISVANDKQGRQWVIGVGVGVPLAALLIVAFGFSAWFLSRRRVASRRGKRSNEAEGPVRYFAYEELVQATNKFSEKLGEGGFGVVYKGWVKGGEGMSDLRQNFLQSPGGRNNVQIAVAVKLLKGGALDEEKDAGHGGAEMQFRAEVKTLGNIHHVNLVSLLGYCTSRRRAEVQRLLVYEYMENGSLDKFLASSKHELLPWATRYSIALGAARGIAYLHHECSPPIMHCDIKPHNILLDNQFTAKVADFGFARRFRVDSHVTMSGIRGTRGYLAPEWLTSQELTSKVDVFSFGMLLLELVRGFKSVDHINTPLVEWAIRCNSKGVVDDDHQQNEKGEISDLASSTDQDQSLELSKEAAHKLQVLKVGLWCIQPNPFMRPAMSRVTQLIDGMLPVEDPPLFHSSLYFVVPPRAISDSEYGSSTATTSTSHFSYSAVSGR